MTARNDFNAVTEAFAAAAYDSTLWPAALAEAAEAAGAFGAVMIPLRGRLPSIPSTESMAGAMDAYVNDQWIHRDERYRSQQTLFGRGVATEFDFITRDEIAKHPYYQDFLAKFRLRWFAGVKVGDASDTWCLSLQRTIQQGPFDKHEIARLAQLSRELAGAAEIARALGFARAEAARHAFELSHTAAVLLNRSGEVFDMTSKAEALLKTDPRIVRRRIVSLDRGATANLDRALHALIWAPDSPALRPPVLLPREGNRPLIAFPSRPPHLARDPLGLCQALVIFVDLRPAENPDQAVLMNVFRLTPAEAKLATCLASGMSLEEIAARLGISYETSRTMLKAIFQKTDTHRQVELSLLLNRLAAAPPNQI